jgi:hypothetical protein
MFTIVMEKGKQREMMKLMGMKMFNYYAVTIITFYVYYVIVVAEILFMCWVFQYRVVTGTNFLLLLIVLFSWGWALIGW